MQIVNHAFLVTGGGSGLGAATVQMLVAQGGQVVIADVSEAGAAAAQQWGAQAAFAKTDVTDEASMQRAFDAAAKAFGKVDIMVNNAGIAGRNFKVWECPAEEFRAVVEVDLIGVFLGCKVASAHMIKNKYGRIVNVASIAGKEGNPTASHYSAAKAGVIALTKSLGKELATSGVLVNCITPAAARTDIFKQITQQHIDYMLSKIPMNRFVEVQEIAAMVAWLSSEDCSFSTGATFDISGGRATY
jgi:3-oxoacyl-[acyl-carrier protein] reductase